MGQCGLRQADFQANARARWFSGAIQDFLGPPWLHPVPMVNFAETFNFVVKPATVHIVLSQALSNRWYVRQLDVKNTFLHRALSETFYYAQPTGFEDPIHPDFIYSDANMAGCPDTHKST